MQNNDAGLLMETDSGTFAQILRCGVRLKLCQGKMTQTSKSTAF